MTTDDIPLKNNNAFFRQLLFLAVLIVVGVVILLHLRFFVGSLLGAITLYVVFRGVLFWLTDKRKWKGWAASLTLVTLNAILLLAAGFFVFKMVASEIPSVDTSQIVVKFDETIASVNSALGFNIAIPDSIGDNAGKYITQAISSILNTTYSFAANIFMMLVIVYFMFAGGRKMENYIYKYSPFRGESLSLLRAEVKNIIFSNAIGIPLVMLGQALAASLIYWILGLNNVFFWGFLTGLCGLVPLIGTGLIYIPIAIFFAVNGNLLYGIILVAYGLLVLSSVDNLIRIMVIGRYADTHPLIVVFGVILGIPLFGFWGIIFGPLLISGFFLLVKIYYVEYQLLNSPEMVADFIKDSKLNSHPEESEVDKTVEQLNAVKATRFLRRRRKKS